MCPVSCFPMCSHRCGTAICCCWWCCCFGLHTLPHVHFQRFSVRARNMTTSPTLCKRWQDTILTGRSMQPSVQMNSNKSIKYAQFILFPWVCRENHAYTAMPRATRQCSTHVYLQCTHPHTLSMHHVPHKTIRMDLDEIQVYFFVGKMIRNSYFSYQCWKIKWMVLMLS